MAANTRKLIFTGLRAIVCVVALGWVLRSVTWYDRVTLPDGRSARVLDRDAHRMLLEYDDGRSEHVPVAGMPDVQLGLKSVLRDSRKGHLLLAVLLFAPVPFLQSLRFLMMFRAQDIHLSFAECTRLCLAGNFLNFVALGSTGGDLVKAYYVAKHTQRKAAALVAIFVDRAVGLLEFAMLPAVVIALTFLAGARDTERLVLPAAMVAAVLCSVTAGLAVLLSPWLRRVLHLQKIAGLLPLQRHIAVAAEAADLYRRRLPALVKALAMTLGGQASFIVAILLAGLSLALPVPWHQYFLYVPLIYIIAAVPISPGGLGLTEAFFVTFLSPLGASPSEVLALALVARLFPMIVSLPGIIVALTGPKLPRPAQMRTELDAG